MTGSPLARAAARGASFTLGAQAVRMVLQLLSVAILARLLSPHDYGLLAIALVLVGLGEVFRDFGLTSASVQAPELSNAQRDNLFWVNVAIGVTLTAVMFAAAGPTSAVTGEPDMLVMTRWLALMFLFNSLSAQHRAMLMRDLKLRALAIVDIAAAATALTAAVVAAVAGAGFGALIIQQLTLGAVTLIGAVLAGRWLPRFYSRSASIGPMIKLGWNLMASNLLNYAGKQIDTVLISLRFGTAPLGLYNRAYQAVMTPLGQARSPLQSVALPVLARVQADRARFDNYVVAAQVALGYVFGIPLAIVAALAEPVVGIMLGPGWSQAAPLLRLFAIAGILTTVAYVGYWVYVSRGLGGELFRYSVVTTSLKIICISIGSYFGLLGVAVAFAIHPAIAWPISLAWLSRVTPMPRRRLYEGAARIITICLGTGLAATAASLPVSGDVAKTALGLAGGLAGVAVLLIVPMFRNDAKMLIAFIGLALKQPRAPEAA